MRNTNKRVFTARAEFPFRIHTTRDAAYVFVINSGFILGNAHLGHPPGGVLYARPEWAPRCHFDNAMAKVLPMLKTHPAVVGQNNRPAFDISSYSKAHIHWGAYQLLIDGNHAANLASNAGDSNLRAGKRSPVTPTNAFASIA